MHIKSGTMLIVPLLFVMRYFLMSFLSANAAARADADAANMHIRRVLYEWSAVFGAMVALFSVWALFKELPSVNATDSSGITT